MPYAFSFHYAPQDLDGAVLDEVLAWCTDVGRLEEAFATIGYVPRGQSKLRPGRPYRRAAALARLEDPKVDSVWLRSGPGAPQALLTAGASTVLAAPWHQLVLVIDDALFYSDDAVAFAHDLVVQCPPLAGCARWHPTHRAAEAVALGGYDDSLAPSVMAQAARTARAAPHWGPKVRGPGWLTYLSAAHFEKLGEAGVRALGAAAWALHPAEEGALIQGWPEPRDEAPGAQLELILALGDLVDPA